MGIGTHQWQVYHITSKMSKRVAADILKGAHSPVGGNPCGCPYR